jgi:hypothetical protein
MSCATCEEVRQRMKAGIELVRAQALELKRKLLEAKAAKK